MQSRLWQLFQQAARNIQSLSGSGYADQVERALRILVQAFQTGHKLLVFGNGGSAADAQHICGELVGRFEKERAGLPALALSANQAMLTAWSNDYGFESVFARQVEALGVPGDVAWGISTSGNSPNVVAALQAARSRGLCTLGLTGASGGKVAPWCDVLMAVPLTSTPRIQEAHCRIGCSAPPITPARPAICPDRGGVIVEDIGYPVSEPNAGYTKGFWLILPFLTWRQPFRS
jgi:D-sedoheptulose 7-phosphate isomerase